MRRKCRAPESELAERETPKTGREIQDDVRGRCGHGETGSSWSPPLNVTWSKPRNPARDRNAGSLIQDFVQIVVDVDNEQTAVTLLFEPLLIRGGLCGAAVGGQLRHVVVVGLADFGLCVRLVAVDVDIEHDQTLTFSGRDIRG